MDTHDTRSQNVNSGRASESDWQRLWFAMLDKPWSSLAIIPTDAGVEAGRVGEALVAVGQMHGERPVRLLNAEGVPLDAVRRVVGDLSAMTRRGESVVVVIDPLAQNPAAIPIARATSAALLVVRVGESRLASARSTIEAVGRDHLLGSLVLGQM